MRFLLRPFRRFWQWARRDPWRIPSTPSDGSTRTVILMTPPEDPNRPTIDEIRNSFDVSCYITDSLGPIKAGDTVELCGQLDHIGPDIPLRFIHPSEDADDEFTGKFTSRPTAMDVDVNGTRYMTIGPPERIDSSELIARRPRGGWIK